MTQRLSVHKTHPQARLIAQAADRLKRGELGVVPTDASYVLACHLGDKAAMERLRQLRGIDDKHLLTLLCSDLSELSQYAQVDNHQYRFLKAWTPGPYTFVLAATKEVPKRLAHPARKTIGLRVPAEPVILALLEQMGEPLLASSLRLPEDDEVLRDPEEILERLAKRVDFVLEDGGHGLDPTTMIEWQDGEALVTRAGLGFDAICAAVKIA
jgi:tRNA threonylcarbamoyl adenosine modification protein (Sua5/YciO/YrdC/YwlC family)